MNKKGPVFISAFAMTDIGRVRQNNEDNFLIANLSQNAYRTATDDGPLGKSVTTFEVKDREFLAAVSDGMGGALAGEVASQMAVDAVRVLMQQFLSSPEYSQLPHSEQFRLAIEQTNKLIHQQSQSSPKFAGMGATFTGATYMDGQIYLAQVGDSRGYIIRGKQFMQITKDQSLVNQLIDAGYLTEEQAQEHVYRNVILQALGAQPDTVVVLDTLPVRQNDVVLLCSDGLSNKVPGPEMAEIVASTEDLEHACQRLIDLANERGGEDNIAVVLFKIDGSDLPPPNEGTPFEVKRVEREAALPVDFLPGLINLNQLVTQAVERADHPPDQENPALDAPVLETESAENPPDTNDHAPVESTPELPDNTAGRSSNLVERHIEPIMVGILIIILLGAAIAMYWYLKNRGHQEPSPPESQLPSLTINQQIQDHWQPWTALMTDSIPRLEFHRLQPAEA